MIWHSPYSYSQVNPLPLNILIVFGPEAGLENFELSIASPFEHFLCLHSFDIFVRCQRKLLKQLPS